MARVFISYAREDLTQARDVHLWLIEAGHEVFLDRDPRDGIAVGEQWRQQLHERLRWANVVVCVVTSAYLASEWCTAEVSMALSCGNRLLPVRAEPGMTHALLDSIQYTDLTPDHAAARVALIEALRRVDTAGDPGWPEDRSPFPGLRPFDVDRHRVFFGRDREVDQLAGLLRSMAERVDGAALLLVGPSGCGKSSLVRAGLLPAMAGEPGWWTLPPMVPGADPVAALARGLATAAAQIGLEWTANHVHAQLDGNGLRRLAADLLSAVPGSPQHLLIVVDQCEELFTQTTPAARARFAQLLGPALAGPVQVVATLRSESLDHLLGDHEFSRLQTQVHTVRPLRHETLRAVIEEPARLAGIGVDEQLVARLIEDTSSGDALPLLAFTLAQLADGVSRGGRLPGTRYEQLGGVRGALIREADDALTEAIAIGARSREQVIAGLLRLVTVDEQGHPTRRRVRREELPAPIPLELDAFVTRRLLTTDTENDKVVIGVAHEAFLSAWPPLAEAIAANASALRARRAVEQAATEWAEEGRLRDRLWGGGQLAAAVTDTGAHLRRVSASPGRHRPFGWFSPQHRVLVADRVDLSPDAREFLHAGIRYDRYRRRRTVTVLSVLLVLALIGAGIAVIQQRRAQEQERATQEQLRIATARQLIAQAGTLLESDPRTALRLAVAAQSFHPGGETRGNLLDLLATTRYAGTLTGHTGLVWSVAFSPDGGLLATTDEAGTVLLWDLTDPAGPRRLERSLTVRTSWVESITFAPQGRILATADNDGTVILWDLTDPAGPQRLGQPLVGHTGPVLSVAFSPDGGMLATADNDGTVVLWGLTDLAGPQRLGQPLVGHTGPVLSVAFSPDGGMLATASGDGTVILWDLTDPAGPQLLGRPLPAHSGPAGSVAFSPDGGILATAGEDAAVIVWDLTDPVQPLRLGEPLTGHLGPVWSVAFAPDKRTLATAGDEGTVILWDLTDPVRPQRIGEPLTGHTDGVLSVSFAPDGATLATAGSDQTAILWRLIDPVQPLRLGEPLTGHLGPVWSVAFAPDKRTLATAGDEGTVILWDLTDPVRPQRIGEPLTGHLGPVWSVAFAPDGGTLATGGDDGTVILWDLTDPTGARQLGLPLTDHTEAVYSVAFSPDGDTLATAGLDGTVIVWGLTDPAGPQRLGQPLADHTGAVFSVAFSPPDGRTLATTSADSTLILWDLTNPAQPRFRQRLTGNSRDVSSVAFVPDGSILAADSDERTVIVWDLTDPAGARRFGQPLIGHNSTVFSVAFSPHGRILATAGDQTVILWDFTDPRRPRRLGDPLGHTGSVGSVAFSMDGRVLATASDDQVVILWDLVELNDLQSHSVKHACAITGGGLDRTEWGRYISGLPYQDTCSR